MRRARQLRRIGRALALITLVVASAGPAFAGPKDDDGLIAVAEGLNSFVEGKNAEALKQLDAALKACAGAACEPGTRAQLHVAIGIVQGAGKKDTKKATAAFENALREDPKIVPDRQFMTPELNKLFAQAKQNLKDAAGPEPPARPPPTKDQLDQLSAAQASLAQKDWSGCMGLIIAAMAEREFAAGKLLLAQCEDTGGLLLEATNDANLAAKFAEEEQNPEVKKRAEELLAKLAVDTPTIVLVIPRSIDNVEVKVDGVAIPKEKIDKPIPHNPGKATIEVKGKKGQFPFSYKTTESFDRGEKVTINAESDSSKNNSAVQQCILAARTAADVNLCLQTGGKGRGLTFRGGLEVMSYNDSTNVNVISPSLFLSAENPTSGWRVGGSYTVDVVSNASPDIIATATRRFVEVRNAGSLAAEVKVGPARVALDGGVSVEPDYVARNVGLAASTDVYNKMITPTIAYHVGFDILGRAKTPFDVFSRDITTHTVDLGTSIVLNPTTVMVVGLTGEFVLGDTSKPYRHIPMFSEDIASRLPRGATPTLVHATRLAPAPFEQLPDSRSRIALLGRIARRFETSTVRADERVYIDSWGMKASTTDARYFLDLSEQLRVGGHARFHIQSPVDFWQRAYTAKQTANGWELPAFRTGDRELGPLFGVTLGGGARYALSELFAINVQVEGIYTQFLDHIYVLDRWGLFAGTTLEVGVE